MLHEVTFSLNSFSFPLQHSQSTEAARGAHAHSAGDTLVLETELLQQTVVTAVQFHLTVDVSPLMRLTS